MRANVESNTTRPRIGPRETVYEKRYQKIFRVRLDFEQAAKELYVTDYGQRAAVVVEGEKGILLTRQYRYLIDRVSWEIPGGRIEDGETVEAGAILECQEETGVCCRVLHPLLMFHPGLDTLHNPTHLFHTTDFDIVAGHRMSPLETLEVVWIPLPTCQEMMFDGRIVDSLSLIALMSYMLRERGK